MLFGGVGCYIFCSLGVELETVTTIFAENLPLHILRNFRCYRDQLEIRRL